MKNKKLKVFAIISISLLIVMFLVSSAFAAESVCTPKYYFNPSNPLPGQQITGEVSFSKINEPVAGLSFALEYDTEKIELVQTTEESGWNKDVQGTTVFFNTANNEGTTKTGKIGTLTFKIKDNAVKSDTTIKIKNQQVALDDGTVVSEGFGEVTQEINISNKEDQYVNPPADTNNNQQDVIPNSNNENNDQKNTQQTERPVTSSDVDTNKIVVVNPSNTSDSAVNTTDKSKNVDSSSANKNLPKTGNTKILPIVITISVIAIAISIISYKKYKNIK